MKKVLFLIPIIIIFFINLVPNYDDEIRIRILPHDNTKESLECKEIVKSALETTILSYKGYDIAYIIENIAEFEDKIKYHIPENLQSQIHVEYCKDFFEAKNIDGFVIPSGKYQTVVITIGDGLGDNWWSILYPDFFKLDYEENKEIDYRSYFYDLFFKEK